MERQDIAPLLLRLRGLALLRGVLGGRGTRALTELLGLLALGAEDGELAASFGRFLGEISSEPKPLVRDPWRSCLLRGLLEDENAFSLAAERDALIPTLVQQARAELRLLQRLYALDSATLVRLVEGAAPPFEGFWTVPESGPAPNTSPASRAASMLAEADDWGACADELAHHFARHGAGPFARYGAFRWRGGSLVPVARPDPVRLDEIVGYEEDRAPLLRNTERFLAGLPAHHALLYGPPGTGKSSTVKALLHEYEDRGLRLVQLEKEELEALPDLVSMLEERGPRFIVFVDDLSFEEDEVEYKRLKALLEGGVEEPPHNVRLYATSNRRNLIRERFSDREDAPLGDDVHARDTMQEKLSLSARFALRVTFPAPDQRRYLEIVSGLVRERGLEVSDEELRSRALLWDRWHAGRSGRTARQFVDELQADLSDAR